MPDIDHLICKCSNCSKEFNLKNSNLRNETKKFGNDTIYIKILKCPLCKFESIVQIDDDVTTLISSSLNSNGYCFSNFNVLKSL